MKKLFLKIYAETPLLLSEHYGILVSGQCGYSCAGGINEKSGHASIMEA